VREALLLLVPFFSTMGTRTSMPVILTRSNWLEKACARLGAGSAFSAAAAAAALIDEGEGEREEREKALSLSLQ
jgi:hypothetical protein